MSVRQGQAGSAQQVRPTEDDLENGNIAAPSRGAAPVSPDPADTSLGFSWRFADWLNDLFRGQPRVESTAAMGRRWRLAVDWVVARLRTTPGLLRVLSIALIAILAVMALVDFRVAGARKNAADAVGLDSEPLLLRAQAIYSALAKADATATNTFLAGGLEPTGQRQRYLADLRSASHQLTVATREIGNSGAATRAATLMNRDLSLYAGSVEAARANNRQNLPVGAAYLRQASTLMQRELLPAADRLYGVEARRLEHEYLSAGSGSDIAAVVAVTLAALALLVVTQLFLIRRSNRILNVPLVAASVLVVVLGASLVTSFLVQQHRLEAARHPASDLVGALSSARVLALRAESDDSLTLVARGSGDQYRVDFDATVKKLGGRSGMNGSLGTATALAGSSGKSHVVAEGRKAYRDYLDVHGQIIQLQDSGQFDEAVARATGTSAGDELPTLTRFDKSLLQGIRESEARFRSDANGARNVLRFLAIAIPIIAIACGALVLYGLQMRINEYR
ncbi:MAG TPA: hypothetical protein VKH36_11935 [Acidimicrobiia bacterium]|nr:hypothetical protein [Acidimicrobiia bacterium]